MENQTRKTDPKDLENGLKMEVTGRGATYILHLACQLPSCLIDENNNRKKKKKKGDRELSEFTFVIFEA